MSLFNLKFLAARVLVYVRQLADGRVFSAVCGQPVFEVGVVGADEDGGVFLVKIDFGGLFLLGRSCSHRLILSAALSRNRGVWGGFSSALDLGKMVIFKQERAGRCSSLSDALPFDKMRFFRLCSGISELRPS